VFLEICKQICSVVLALCRQINKHKVCENNYLLCAGNKVFVKYQAQGGVTPTPLLCTPLNTGNKERSYLQHPQLSRSLWWSWNEACITIRPDAASWCATNSCEKRYSNCFYLRVIDYTRSDTSLYSTESWSRICSLRQFRWLALKYFFGLYFKYFINWKLWNWGDVSPLATCLVATVSWLQVTDQRSHSWLSEGCMHTDLVIQINQHSYQQSWRFSLHNKSVYCVHR